MSRRGSENVRRRLQTRRMPTVTQRDLESATAGLDALERNLKALIAGDLAKLEEAFAAAGAPWT
jgi:hypothetical protein